MPYPGHTNGPAFSRRAVWQSRKGDRYYFFFVLVFEVVLRAVVFFAAGFFFAAVFFFAAIDPSLDPVVSPRNRNQAAQSVEDRMGVYLECQMSFRSKCTVACRKRVLVIRQGVSATAHGHYIFSHVGAFISI